MSDSKRKPYWVISHRSGNTKFYKRQATKAFRNFIEKIEEEIKSSAFYKKLFCSYDIKDYCSYACSNEKNCEDCFWYNEDGYCKVKQK